MLLPDFKKEFTSCQFCKKDCPRPCYESIKADFEEQWTKAKKRDEYFLYCLRAANEYFDNSDRMITPEGFKRAVLHAFMQVYHNLFNGEPLPESYHYIFPDRHLLSE